MTDRELMQQALEALEWWEAEFGGNEAPEPAITALRERLAQPEHWIDEMAKVPDHVWAQPEQEPAMCRVCGDERGSWAWLCNVCGAFDESPQPRKPLTDEEITDAVREAGFDWHYGWTLDDEEPNRFTKFARSIEAAHGIKGEA